MKMIVILICVFIVGVQSPAWGGPACDRLYSKNLTRFRSAVREVIDSKDSACLKQANSFLKLLLPECLQESQPQLVCEENLCYWSDARAKLTKSYAKERLGYATCDLKPKLIVTHYTESASVAATDSTFKPLKSERPDIQGVNTSCHYIVGPNGDIHKRMDECQMARHVIGLNEHAICIENVALDENHLTANQIEADAKLIHYLTSKFTTIDTMIGHSESESLNKIPSLYRNLVGSPSGHTDPGPGFLKKLRKNLAERCGKSASAEMSAISGE